MAALLMSIYLCGMEFRETADLTRSMLESGIRMNLHSITGAKIDKHSTGGVGDKISLVLAPMVAAAGVKVPMISGRGLAHSGGTLDKLDAIPGFRTQLTIDEFYQQIKEIGVSLIGQTDRICPADKKMYALRDATATIESIPLITASILSKKLAEGIDGLVLDVKTGIGAFMRRLEEARALADSLVKTAELEGLPTIAIITNMDQPLGYAAGNWLETREAIDCLRDQGPRDVMELSLTLGAYMLIIARQTDCLEEARQLLREQIKSGKALETFYRLVERQGGDVSIVKKPETYPKSKVAEPIHSTKAGYIQAINAAAVGRVVMMLGGGRAVMEDQIEYKAGVVLANKVGDYVKSGRLLATLYTDFDGRIDQAKKMVVDGIVIQPEKPDVRPLIIETLNPGGSDR